MPELGMGQNKKNDGINGRDRLKRMTELVEQTD
jgi:hypothetical protein